MYQLSIQNKNKKKIGGLDIKSQVFPETPYQVAFAKNMYENLCMDPENCKYRPWRILPIPMLPANVRRCPVLLFFDCPFARSGPRLQPLQRNIQFTTANASVLQVGCCRPAVRLPAIEPANVPSADAKDRS